MRNRGCALLLIALVAVSMLLSALPVGGTLDVGNYRARLLSSEAGAGAGTVSDMMLHLAVQDLDPLKEPFLLPESLRAQRVDGLYIVQVAGPTTAAWRERVARLGGQLLAYVPDNAYIAYLPPAVRLAIADLDAVRWVGPYHPGLRVESALWQETGPVLDIAVSCFGSPVMVASEVLRLGGIVTVIGTSGIQGAIPRDRLDDLASFGGVCWVQKGFEVELFNDHSARLVSARQGVDGHLNPSASNNRMWSWDDVDTPAHFNGTIGTGYIASVADTGLDEDHLNNPLRLPTKNYLGAPTTQDTYGHGTHVAGTMCGQGIPMAVDSGLPLGKYAGVAPGATVFMQDIFEGFDFYMNFDVIGRDASAAGAVVNSNSWGEYHGGTYGTFEQIYDTMTIDAQPAVSGEQDILFCFSAGNAGPGQRTLGSPSAAKNVISVGATGNDKQGTSGSSIAGFSSRGPASDGRVKPDLVTPGVDVVSSAAHPAQIPFQPPADGGQSWTYMSGTSMSCPAAAGCVVLATDHVEHAWGHANPSPALIKALLINGADKLVGSTYPDPSQGWGRINLTTLKDTPVAKTFFYDQEQLLSVGGVQSQRYIYFVNSSRPFKVTLDWTDFPGTPSASKALVSDLDLVVTAPDGTVYMGNNFNSNAQSQEGGTNDTVNNVERFALNSPMVGYWSIEVRASNTPSGPQDFALVARGDLFDRWVDIAPANVTVSEVAPDEGDLVRFSGEVLFTGTQGIGLSSYKVALKNLNTSEVTLFEEDQIPSMVPGQSRSFTHLWTAKRGWWEFIVNVTYTGQPIEFSKDNNHVSIPAFVRGYGLVAELSAQSVTVWPGLESMLELHVLNPGNVPDSYTLLTEGVPVAWGGALGAPEVRLGPDRSASMGLSIIPPLASKAGELYTMSVLVTSQGNSSYRQRLPFTVTVGQVYGLRSTLTVEGRSVLPGKTSVHEFTIANTGNGVDTFLMDVTGLPEGWTATLSDTEVELEDNATRTVRVELHAPEQALMNDMAAIDIEVKSTGGLGTDLEARTRVKQVRGIDLVVTTEPVIMPGGKVYYEVMLSNMGNGIDVFGYIETLPRGWRSDFPHSELVLDAYEVFTHHNGTIGCPKGTVAGTYTLVFQAELFDQVVVREVEVRVQEVYSMRALLTAGASAMYPGNSTTYVVEVYNLGNLPTEFGFALEGVPASWTLTYGARTQTIGVNQKGLFSVTVATPATATPGFQGLSYKVTYGGDRELKEGLSLYLIELPEHIGDDGGGGGIPASLIYAIVTIIVVVVLVAVALVLVRRRKASAPLEIPVEYEEHVGPPPSQMAAPPPQAAAAMPMPPRPVAQPRTTEELLSGTSVMHRESRAYDAWSADREYASGKVLRSAPAPVYMGDCQFCGGRVLEHSSGAIMCEKCGAQFTHE